MGAFRYAKTILMRHVHWSNASTTISVGHRSAGLTIVANVANATGLALLGALRSFVLNLFLLYLYGRVDIRI